ncbi:hypothetical protein [Massilia scottii]|uniref:hypothetical protein n=1 Tax=Massilia scottii TaxID=3057166 RepID=UPI0027967EF1|nr:hypothetical protein [Massilia sp. CCM 9029]MDQ1835562.1 hypothetical protein [Massilia sp. CCM 9029]
MVSSAEAEKRKALRHEFRALFDALSKLLFEADPIGINFETNTDEYEPEVGTIIPRLKQAQSEDDVRRIIHEEFCKWFDVETAGPVEAYGGIASKVWAEWLRYR